jgi:alkylation response protein AidB-like acyl-CoA dehydrogenase
LAIFAEMMAEAELSRQLNIVGLELAASMIMAFGTESQKERHLTAILCGDEIWCQLFSEPNAGSDLASLSCRAIESNGQWLVSGQRVWTSGAHFSDYGLLLAKTKPGQPNHKAISCFLLPMNRAGIEIRPLVQMDGEAKFNEVFLNDVKADSSELLGELGQGWQVAMSTLDRERLSLGAQAVALLDWLERLRSDLPGRLNDPNIRQAWIGLWNRIRLLRMTWLRAVNTTGPDADSAIAVLKVVASELQRDVASHAVDYLGMFAQAGDDRGAHRQRFLAASRATIAGGTSEIQRNILGERILDLPRGPR